MATGRNIRRLQSPRKPRNWAILARPLFSSSSSGNFLRMRVIYTEYKAAETRASMSPSRGFEAIALKVIRESPRLTIIVPPIQRRTLISFTQVKFSPKNARETKKVNRLDALLKMVFDCKQQEQRTNQTQNLEQKNNMKNQDMQYNI